ncbi:MAG: cardiolipin synthase [Bacillota bacterium]|nr:cardiolipin synthase [Bacillota bacterium]
MNLIFILLLIFIWLNVDFYLGRKKHRASLKNEESPLLYGNFDIFPHGKELFADYFQELKRAKKHIHVLFYILKDDAVSHEFVTLLKEKAQEGVEVRLLLDRLGSYKVKHKTIKDLREAGVLFAFSNRIKFPFFFYSSQVRNHRKISIIDGTIGYLGGFNIGKEYIDMDPKLSPWRDYHLKITGESVLFLQKQFFHDWLEYAGENLSDTSSYYPIQPMKGSIKHKFFPTEGCFLEDSYIKIIQEAKSSITIGTPYFIPSQKILHCLVDAVHRGVNVNLIAPYTADHILVQEASYPYLRKLLKAGVEVFQFKNGFYHAKTMIIDDQLCDIGTANFDKRSLFINKEINCYIYDPEFTKRLKKIIQKDIQDSEPLTLQTLNKLNPIRSIKEGIGGLLSSFL